VIVENITFRLVEGADEEAFIAADSRMQQEFFHAQPGFVRRTAARSDDGEWLECTFWETRADAEASAEAAHNSPAAKACLEFMDLSTFRVSAYTALDQ
jgi:hypothetical protein